MSAAGDTDGVERDLQDRVARFARFVFLIEIPMFTIGRVLTALGPNGLSLKEFTSPQRVPQEISIVLLFAAWRRCRGAPLSKPVLEAIDAGLTFVLCTSWAMFGFGAHGGYPTVLSIILAVTHTLVIRSVVVPSSFERTLWLSIVSTLPTALILARYGSSFVRDSSTQYGRVFLVFAVAWCIIAAVVSAVNSRTLYGLRKQIREVRKLGQYTLEEKIGEGGMGVVHRATHAMLRRPAAIKLLSEGRSNAEALARFEREVQLTSRLAHPNTISIFDYGRTADGVFYYVMEYLDGMDLDRLIEAEGPIEPGRAIHILAQVSGALAEAHALGLIHRDIKPANIVLTERADEPDVVKVLDFGLVKTIEPSSSDSIAREPIVGTPLYLAPEAITAPSTVDARADLYAVGAVAYFLITGKHVFEAATTLEMFSKHLIEAPVSPSERLGRSLPSDLEALVLACLAKEPGARPRSATALREGLLHCAETSPYDAVGARAWWQSKGMLLRARPRTGKASHTTMAIDLRERAVAP